MGSRLGLKTLAAFGRQMSTMLDAGLPLRRALAVMEKGARPQQKALYQRLGARIDQGQSLGDAVENESGAFPTLFVRLVRVGEMVGGLDKVFKRLADYYDFIRQMWMRLLGRLAYPIFQFWALILILSGLAYIRSMILETGDRSPRAALTILVTGTVIFVAPIVGYFVATRSLTGSRSVHEVLIRLPVIGAVFRTLALARFSWSMDLMTDAGVNIFNALQWSLQATANGAYEGRGEEIAQRIKDGMPLSRSLEMSGLFPTDYVEMVHVAEESGSMPEMFGRLAKNYFEKADYALSALSNAFSWFIRICVGGVIVYYIFTMWQQIYLGPLQQALHGGD